MHGPAAAAPFRRACARRSNGCCHARRQSVRLERKACSKHAKETTMALAKVAAVAGLLSMVMATAQAAEAVVLSTTAAKESMFEIIPAFERASGHKINFTFTNGPVMADRIRAGLAGDLFIGPDEY